MWFRDCAGSRVKTSVFYVNIVVEKSQLDARKCVSIGQLRYSYHAIYVVVKAKMARVEGGEMQARVATEGWARVNSRCK